MNSLLEKPGFEPCTLYVDRDRPDDDDDVSSNFGMRGIYLMLHSVKRPTSCPAELHLHPDLVYLGHSCRGVEHRLEQHPVVRAYATTFGDPKLARLWVSVWYVGGTAFAGKQLRAQDLRNVMRVKELERRFLREFVDKHDRLPTFNID